VSVPPAGYRLAEVAAALSGELVGDGERRVSGLASPGCARADELALAVEPEALSALALSAAGAAVVAGAAALPERLAGAVRVARPRQAMARLLELFERPAEIAPGIHPTAVVDPTAELGPGVTIGALSHVGPRVRIGAGTVLYSHVTVGAGAMIGDACRLYPGVRIGDRVIVGRRVIIQPNASIGADGFSYAPPAAPGEGPVRLNSIGTVELEDEVEVGACSTIDRATIEVTRIGRGTKIDNLVLIGHNTTIGRSCLIAGRVGIAGSCRIGDRVVLAGGVGVADHLTIGDGAVVMAGSGVGRHVEAGTIVGGLPAVPRDEFMSSYLSVKRLKRMLKRLEDIEQQLSELRRRDG
jgi:UDP-3-O-[3-hydroxymyristoyl] glucosamine N-acyltransferase